MALDNTDPNPELTKAIIVARLAIKNEGSAPLATKIAKRLDMCPKAVTDHAIQLGNLLGKDAPICYRAPSKLIGVPGNRGKGGGRPGVSTPKSPNIAKLIADDPGGSTKEDIYRQCLLQDAEQCNWRMRRSLKSQ